jgi:phosphoribosylanthranilate isomerase
MPSGPGPIYDHLIAEIARTIPPPLASFLLTSEQSANGIIDHIRKVQTNTVQLVDELMEGSYELIREQLPHVNIVQVIHVTGEESIEQAMKIEQLVDAILLDSGNPKAEIKTLGGTGNTHDWKISRRIVESLKVPVFLAGGLNAFNVKEAINEVGPFAVDICSGVRTNGKLDPAKLDAFIDAVQHS